MTKNQDALDPAQSERVSPEDYVVALLSPIDLGPFTLASRIVSTGHAPRFSSKGVVSEQEVAFYARKAAGGFPLITTGTTAVHPTGESPGLLTNFDDSVLESYKRLSQAIHQHDSKMMIQLAHRGASVKSKPGGPALWAPSRVVGDYAREIPQPMTRENIDELVDAFGAAAGRVRRGELDGIELSAYAGGLASQFLSPNTNLRTDDYGGCLENRARFLLEVLRACRSALGADLALSLKFTVDDLVPGGMKEGEALEVVRMIDHENLVDWYVAAAGSNMDLLARVDHMPPTPALPGLYAKLAERLKCATDRPVAALGRIVDPYLAGQLVVDGTCDLVAVARAGIADPDFVNKLRSGDGERIRPCVGLNVCLNDSRNSVGIRCVHNVEIGRELVQDPRPGDPIAVLVIGGGVAGLEAARTAASRGHRVTLLESSNRLGGAAALAAAQPGLEETIRVVHWLESQVADMGVDIKLSTQATIETVRESDSDLVIVATGAHDVAPPIQYQGVGSRVISARAAIGSSGLGRTVVVIDDLGQQLGCAVAELAASQGATLVRLVTKFLHPALDTGPTNYMTTYRRLRQRGVRTVVNHRLQSVQDRTVHLVDVFNNEPYTISDVDTVIINTLPEPNMDIAKHILPGVRMIRVGDCVAPRDIQTAMAEGHEAAVF